MAIKTLRVFAEYTSTGFVPMPVAGGIDYGYTLANTFPSTTPSTFQTDDPDIDVTVTAMTDFYVWIRINGTAWNPSYTRNVRVYPDSPDINSVVMNMIIATGPAGVSSYTQIVQTANRLYFNGATTDSTYNSKFAGKTYINELNFGTAPGLSTVATTGAYSDLTGKPALATVATSGSFADLSSKPSGTAPISYNSGTNSFQITQANTTTNGFLTSTDWNTFNNKFATPTGDTTQYVDGTGGLQTFPVLASADKLVMVVRNTSGATITKGTVVYINGASGNKPTIAKALANSDATSAQTLGLVQADISNNSNGNVILVGSIIDINTSSFTEGQQLYLSGTTAGAYTSTKTLAPTHLVYVGIVTRAHPTQGVIEVKIQNGYELDELHDVAITSVADKDVIYRDVATNLWKNASVTSVLGFTPYNATNPSNYIARTALSASAPLSYNNTTGAFTIAQANGSTNGFLSSTDWTTFNSKQSALTLGNVSESVSNVLMFPDGGTGKTIGNLSIQVVQSSASTNGYLSSTDWTTFNNKQATLPAATASVNGYLTSTDWTTFNNKQVTITGGASTITTSNLTINRALISNASGKVDVSTVTSTELGYLSGVTSAIQTQLNTKAATLSGTTNYLPKFTSSSAIGNSNIQDNGTTVTITQTNALLSLTTNGAAGAAWNQYVNLGGTYLIGADNSGGSLSGGTSFAFAINAPTGRAIVLSPNNIAALTLASTGAATFSSSVNVNSQIASSSTNGTVLIRDNTGQIEVNIRHNNSTNGVLSFAHNGFADRWAIGTKPYDGNLYFSANYDLSTTRVVITAAGNTLMGTTSDPGYRLYVNGQIYATGNITANSDLTLKKNLKLIENPIDKLMSLNGYSYQWKADNEYQYGVIAQEVEKILPYAVSTGNDGIKGVSYNQIIPVLIEAVKLQQIEITELKAKLA